MRSRPGTGTEVLPPAAGAITSCGGASSDAAVTNATDAPSGDQRGWLSGPAADEIFVMQSSVCPDDACCDAQPPAPIQHPSPLVLRAADCRPRDKGRMLASAAVPRQRRLSWRQGYGRACRGSGAGCSATSCMPAAAGASACCAIASTS